MNDDRFPQVTSSEPVRESHTLGSSTIYRLCEEVIQLRETNSRQHKLFDQAQARSRDELRDSFNSFAADTQRAYQQLRQEIHGEKRVSLALLNELLEVGQDLEGIVGAKPEPADAGAVASWMEAIEVEYRKVQAALLRHGIVPYDAAIGTKYTPALHERVASAKVEGMAPLLVAEQRERGYASQQPEFVLRRPKVVVSE